MMTPRRIFRAFPALALVPLMLSACIGKPPGVEPVGGFELERYLGKWYEVARLDHSFERGLQKVTAEYSLRPDGGVQVINRGFSPEKGEWQQAEGKAYFVEEENLAYLKVSFFGPFYGSYIVFELDREQYRYAFVSGPDSSYLWLLARDPDVPESVKQAFIRQSDSLGFDLEELVWVEH